MRSLVLAREIIMKEFQHHVWIWMAIALLWAIPITVSTKAGEEANVVGLHLVTPLLALWLGMRAIQAEVREKSLALLFTRPIRRERLMALRLSALGAMAIAAIVVGAALNALGMWILQHGLGSMSGARLTSNLNSQDLLGIGSATISTLLGGVLIGAWMEPVVGRIRQVAVVLAVLTASVVVSNLTLMEGLPVPVREGILGVILLGACLGLIRQLQVRG